MKVSLKHICREIKMEPRTARMTLRNLANDGKFEHGFKQRYEWEPKQAEKVKKLLEGAKS